MDGGYYRLYIGALLGMVELFLGTRVFLIVGGLALVAGVVTIIL